MQEIKTAEYNRVYWRSRRGMLELDNILKPFVENKFESLQKDDQESYIQLVECEDTELYSWLCQGNKPDKKFVKIVNYILQV